MDSIATQNCNYYIGRWSVMPTCLLVKHRRSWISTAKPAISDLNDWSGMHDCLSYTKVPHADVEAFQSRHVRGYGVICCFPRSPWTDLLRITADEQPDWARLGGAAGPFIYTWCRYLCCQ